MKSKESEMIPVYPELPMAHILASIPITSDPNIWLKCMAKNWPRLVPIWVFRFHIFQQCHPHRHRHLCFNLSSWSSPLCLTKGAVIVGSHLIHSCETQLPAPEDSPFEKTSAVVLFLKKVCTHFRWDYWKPKKIAPESRWHWCTHTTMGRDLPVLRDTKTGSEKLFVLQKHFLCKTQI